MDEVCNNYLCHTNEWYWGKTVDIIHKQGIGIICVKLEDDYPVTAYICDLSVFVLNRRKGIGTELMLKMLAKLEAFGYARTSLSVQKENPALASTSAWASASFKTDPTRSSG
jgi:ribosomal protein S18 acetylase RimI-like enzyme